MTSDFEGFSSQMLSIFLSYLKSKERASISYLLLSAKQGNYWYNFYNIVGIKRSLTVD